MNIPATMRAIGVKGGKGTADDLYVQEVAVPTPKPGEMLVRVRAAGVNRPDIEQRRGNYPPPPGASDVIGLEIAGEIVAFGGDSGRWSVGDRVAALLPGGGYAEYATVDCRHALPIPDGIEFAQAAALPETVYTVWANLFERGRLQAGETVLVHGANSGIGVTAIQMAKAAGARVIATARGAAKAQKARELGADLSIDALAEDFAGPVRAAGGADVVLDIVGAEYFDRNIAVLNPDGRLVQIAFLSGTKVEFDLVTLLFKRLSLMGSTLRARPADEKARLTRAIEEAVWPWVAAGQLRPPVDRSFALEQAGDAHRHLESGAQFGKFVLLL